MPPPHPPFPRTHLLLDWDSTLTHTDTLALIARINHHHPHPSRSKTPAPFSILTSAYTTDLHAHTTAYLPPAPDRRTVAAELRFQASLRPVEERSVRRVEAAGVFQGVRGGEVDAEAERCVEGGEVVLRAGWGALVAGVAGAGDGRDGREVGKGKVGVVSVGWSGRFIRGCLLHAAAAAGAGEGLGEVVKGMEIVANEIEGLDNEEGSDGMLSRWFAGEGGGGVWTAGDKGRVVRRLIAGEEAGVGRMRTVYVGDSVTDLECLMLVDVGVCVRDEPLQSGQEALREVLERVGVQCKWIGEMGRENIGRGGQGGESAEGWAEKGLWWARDFEEIWQSALFCGASGPKMEL